MLSAPSFKSLAGIRLGPQALSTESECSISKTACRANGNQDSKQQRI